MGAMIVEGGLKVVRPEIVDERSRIGDWEVDTVIGKPGGSVLVTLAERITS